MGEAQGVVRTNISVPRQLKARMDKVKVPVNWSAVAAQAFEAKVLELESTKEVKGMDDVIARLKAADEQDNNQDYLAGKAAGERWAKERARPKHLRRLANLSNRGSPGITAYDEWDPYGWPSFLCCTVTAWKDADREKIKSFWQEALGDDADRLCDGHFAIGVCDGAREVWHQVKDQVEGQDEDDL